MRIVLIYPPPWQIPSAGDPPGGMPFGPPKDIREHAVLDDGDFLSIPYGVLTIAAQARRAGHAVDVLDLADAPWRKVIAQIAASDATVYGISAFTANRRGMGAVAQAIRQMKPDVHITAGGPFVTALPLHTLRHYPEIDTAVVGEGEDTFLELIACLDARRSCVGIAGTAWREGDAVVLGPPRPLIKNLDTIASPFDHFTPPIVLTSRECPSRCTFCGSPAIWGKWVRFHSVAYTIDTFRKALARQPVPVLFVKDDTFTAHRRRAMAICEAILESGMNFLWGCDTRVDSVNDELLSIMRRAGCQAVSFGVESGCPNILARIRKRTTPEMVITATHMAQKYGMHVRYYMIIGNRGENEESVKKSIELIKTGRPNTFIFCALSFFPGTEEWEILCAEQRVTPEIFFYQ